jgi:hypothetical protein
VLSLVAIAAMLAYAAYQLELGPHESVAAYTQEIQPAGSSYPVKVASQAAAETAASALYTGTIVKHNADFVLRGSTGVLYHLDNPTKAEAFAGKSVKVTGKLDETATVIHVEKIEELRV